MSRLRRVKSFENFSEELQERDPELVVVQGNIQYVGGPLSASMTGAVGRLGVVQHGLLYTALKLGRNKQYAEQLFTSFQSEWGLGDRVKRDMDALRLLLAGEVRVEFLKTVLPEAEIYLAGADPLQPMNEQQRALIHEQAQEYEIEVPVLNM